MNTEEETDVAADRRRTMDIPGRFYCVVAVEVSVAKSIRFVRIEMRINTRAVVRFGHARLIVVIAVYRTAVPWCKTRNCRRRVRKSKITHHHGLKSPGKNRGDFI